MVGCLCIHGFTGGAYEVEPLADYLRSNTNWDIVVPTLPGHGESLQLEGVAYKQWIDHAETELLKLMETCDEVYLVGFSMGGMIASYLAAKYEVSKLVLLSPSRKYIYFKQMSIDVSRFIKKGFVGGLSDDPVFQRYQRKRGSVPFRALLEFVKCMRYTKPHLEKVTCPVFIAQGIQDGMVPYKAAVYLDKEIPTETQVVFFNDSKHHICLGTDKDTLINQVDSFLLQHQLIKK